MSGIPGAEGAQAANPFGSPNDEIVFEVDLTDVDAGGGAGKLPENDYIAYVKSLVPGRSRSSGNPMWTATLEILAPQEFMGKERRVYLTFGEKSLWKVEQFVSAIGLGGAGQQVRFTPQQAIGRTLTMNIYHKEGERFDQVGDLSPPPEGVPEIYQGAAQTAGVPS